MVEDKKGWSNLKLDFTVQLCVPSPRMFRDSSQLTQATMRTPPTLDYPGVAQEVPGLP